MIRRPALAALTAAVLLACLASPAMAQWKWRDKSGQITVSDLPPPRDVPEKDILQRPDPTAVAPVRAAAASEGASSAAARPPVDPQLEARRREAEQQQAAKAKAEADKLAEQRAQNCRNARSQLAALDSGQRIARINDKGEREIIDDKQRAEETRRARAVIASDCR